MAKECGPPEWTAAQCAAANSAPTAGEFTQEFTLPSAASSRYWRWVAKTRWTEFQVYLQEIEFHLAAPWGWFFILFEVFSGESSKASGDASQAVKKSFANMRLIVSVGWSIYPLGYFLGFLTGIADQTTLNVVYNIADLVNKICFVLACWACAKEDSEK